MTRKELSQLFYLKKEIKQDSIRLMELDKASAGSNTSITGLPHTAYISDKTVIAADIADLKKEIEIKMDMCITQYNHLMKYIDDVEDSYIRQILTFRHVNGYSWVQVAMRMGGGNTEDGVRKAYSRYLKKAGCCS